MLRRVALWLAALSAASSAAAEPVRVAVITSAGAVVIEVDQDRAPVTAGNFLRYVDRRLFDGAAFYRAMRLGAGSGLIQGGVNFRRTLPPVAHEPTTQTGLSHVDGAVSMARADAGSARSDFFIIVGDAMTGLDAGPNSGGDQLGYAVFGRVVEGMDVVRRILEAPTSATEGEGAMRGQMLAPRIRIVSARRAD
jgi:peptidyl-prolyl cis-trans isomerase A (cyclophilin A)